jgi:hypothetical protein
MLASDVANRPQWRGQPGFFEIWFLVVFDPRASRAWWLRYTTFAPIAGAPRATVWAAAFDAMADPPAVGLKAIVPASAYDAGAPDRFGVRIGDAELTNETARGTVGGAGRRIAWDLAFTPAAAPARRGPAVLDRLPLPTHVAHANSEIACRGWIDVDGVRVVLDGAPAVQKHIWGTRRVEELFWLYCPRFAEDADARLEATAVRARRRLVGGLPAPRLVPLWLRTGDAVFDRTGLGAALGNGMTTVGPARVVFEATSAHEQVIATATCDPRTLVGWVYRDPAGWDVQVAQSDVASCRVEIRRRRGLFAPWQFVRELHGHGNAALEFHHPEPLPGVRYVAWDELC